MTGHEQQCVAVGPGTRSSFLFVRWRPKQCSYATGLHVRLAAVGVPSSTGRYAVIGCKLKQNVNEGCNSCARVVQVLRDLFYVLLHVLFYF